ncbi:radical SAM protein [bacterium]|nr:radical SAM protein [bacterium]
MQSALVFSPLASPTYVPFGLAMLVSHVNQSLADHHLNLFDFNLSLWRQLTENHPAGESYLNFVYNKSLQFYDPQVYDRFHPIQNQIYFQISRLSQQARTYIEKDELDPGLQDILELQSQTLLNIDPRVIGFSVMYLDQLNFTLALAKYTRRQVLNSGVRLVLGGASMLALDAEALLAACPYIDGIILGEGEAGLTALLSGEKNEQIPGLLARTAMGIVRNKRNQNASDSFFLTADYSQYALAEYFNPETVLPVVFSRDCQWGRCRFCAHNFSFSGFRQRTVTSFVDELEQLNHQYGVRVFYFADQYISAENLELIAREILSRHLRIAYHIMCRPEASYTLERLQTIALSGCRWISWGVESGSQRLLDLIKKGTRVSDIETVLRNAAAVGISNLAMMIFGLPTSSNIDLWQTFALLEKTQDYLDGIKASSYVLYENTYFAKKPERFGMSVSGAQKLLKIGNTVVHSTKLNYREVSSSGSLRPPCGAIEVAEWEKRTAWMKKMDFLDKLPCQHYLLYANHHYETRKAPDEPFPRSA